MKRENILNLELVENIFKKYQIHIISAAADTHRSAVAYTRKAEI
jgi:hypothetical protein